MRKVIATVAWGLALATVSCKPSKPAEDASTTSEKKDDGTEKVKWEGASKEDQEARSKGPPAGSQTGPTVKENEGLAQQCKGCCLQLGVSGLELAGRPKCQRGVRGN